MRVLATPRPLKSNFHLVPIDSFSWYLFKFFFFIISMRFLFFPLKELIWQEVECATSAVFNHIWKFNLSSIDVFELKITGKQTFW